MISAANIVRADDPYEQLIANIITVESQPQTRLRMELAEQKRLKGVISDMGSKLSALHKTLETFSDPLGSPFDARSANLSSTSSFSVSAGGSASYGSHAVQVERLATTDARISSQLTAAGTSLRSFFDANGAQTFSIGIDADGDAHSIDVTIDPEGATDAEILQEIADAIGTAMSDAAEAGTITSQERASASVVNETSSTARLSLRSGGTGFAERLTFTDSTAGLLGQLGVFDTADPNRLASGTTGGQVTAVGTSETDSELNAKFTLDGLTLYRSSNQVTDALTGVTLSLKATAEAPTSFSVTPDATSIKDDVADFIKKYNDVLGYISAKSTVDGDAQIRGDFAGDSAFTGLRFSMRADLVRSVSGQPADGPQAITDLGIKINNDGTLTLEDEEALLAAVEQNADAVQSLFSGDDGIAKRLETRLDQYVGSSGLITQREGLIDDRIDRIDNRIDDWDERLGRRENQLRNEFARMQEVIQLFQGQQSLVTSFLLSSYQ